MGLMWVHSPVLIEFLFPKYLVTVKLKNKFIIFHVWSIIIKLIIRSCIEMISDRGVFVEVDTSNTKIHILRQFKDFNFGFTSHGTTLFWTLIFRTYLDLLLLEQVELYTAVFNYNSTPKKLCVYDLDAIYASYWFDFWRVNFKSPITKLAHYHYYIHPTPLYYWVIGIPLTLKVEGKGILYVNFKGNVQCNGYLWLF